LGEESSLAERVIGSIRMGVTGTKSMDETREGGLCEKLVEGDGGTIVFSVSDGQRGENVGESHQARMMNRCDGCLDVILTLCNLKEG
jgi:hypothetical protein